MRLLLILITVSSIFGEKYTEKRKVTDSNGKTFTCTYSLTYTGTKVNMRKSSVKCAPNTAGKTVTENIEIEAIGTTFAVTHTIRKGTDKITKVSVVEESTELPTEETGGPGLLDCSCKLPNSTSPTVRYLKRTQEGSDRSILAVPLPLRKIPSLKNTDRKTSFESSLDRQNSRASAVPIVDVPKDVIDVEPSVVFVPAPAAPAPEPAAPAPVQEPISPEGEEPVLIESNDSAAILESIFSGENSALIESLLSASNGESAQVLQTLSEQLGQQLANTDVAGAINNAVGNIDIDTEEMTNNVMNMAVEMGLQTQDEVANAWGEAMANMNVTGTLSEVMSSGEMQEMVKGMEIKLRCSCDPVEV